MYFSGLLFLYLLFLSAADSFLFLFCEVWSCTGTEHEVDTRLGETSLAIVSGEWTENKEDTGLGISSLLVLKGVVR